METVKSVLSASLLKEFGPGCVMELDTTDRCIKIELTPVSRDHVIYVRPDKHEQNFLCHYAHKADLENDIAHEKNGDMLAWKQQNVAQLPRKVKGAMGIFATVAMWYVRQAAERIDLMKELGGRRGDSPMIETFKEAKAREKYCRGPKNNEEPSSFPHKSNKKDPTKKKSSSTTGRTTTAAAATTASKKNNSTTGIKKKVQKK